MYEKIYTSDGPGFAYVFMDKIILAQHAYIFDMKKLSRPGIKPKT